jgi:steroid 5-alpha reductase family enzyme
MDSEYCQMKSDLQTFKYLILTSVSKLFVTLFCFSLQAQSFYQFKSYPEKYHLTAPFLIGITLWTIGFCVNLSSDNILRNLRQTPGYKIPHGGLFRYVSCANFTGEIFEWFGFAIASQSLAGWAFLAFVCANLIPRACSHHSWYIEKFEDYPKGRRAVFPFIW